MSRIYFDALRSLKGDRHDLLLENQRDWLKQRNGRCAEPFETCLAQQIDARLHVIAVCFRPNYVPPDHLRHEVTCPYYHHAGCPALDMAGSADLTRYPFLLKSAIDAVKKSLIAFDCTPDTDVGGSRDSNMESIDETIVFEKPGFVSVKAHEDFCARGAIHCYSTESLGTYDIASSREISIDQLLPAFAENSSLDLKIRDTLDGHIERPCCEQDDPKTDAFFSDLNGVASIPSGWTVTDRGDLKLAYTYIALGHTYLASGVVPRSIIIGAVAPRYRTLFSPPPPQPQKSGPPPAAGR